ncbi:MAG TPA: MBL fold metallo-hydrolase [Amnibacterium sp.]|nr:MBL fold metallo-hydrolase [Amnibacterium sp.]
MPPIVPSVPAWAEALAAGHDPGPDRVADDLVVLAVPITAAAVVGATLAVLIRDAAGGVHVVDPGWDTPANRRLLTEAVAGFGGPLRQVVVTHLHPDHLGLAGVLRATTGAAVVLHEAEQEDVRAERTVDPLDPASTESRLDAWGVPDLRRPELRRLDPSVQAAAPPAGADLVVRHGDRLDVPGWSLDVLHTPGHTRGSICLHDAGRGLLLTGDTVLPAVYPGVGLGGRGAGNAIDDHLASLAALESLDVEVLPGHGYRFRGLAERVAAMRAHHLRRSAEIAAVLAAQPDASTWAIARAIRWSAGFEHLTGHTLRSALAQTDLHVARIRAA